MKRLSGSGFTLIEVLIMAPVIMVTIVVIMGFMFNQYGQLTQQGAQINLNVEAQNVVFSMQDDIFYANAFTSTMNSNLADAYKPAGGWSANTTPQTLIISTPAITANRRADTRQSVFINTVGCDPSVLQDNSPLYNNVVYFTSSDHRTLYKRTITAPSTLATCGSSYTKQSCPVGNTSNTCPADVVVSSLLDSFTLTYYDNANNVTTTPEQATKVRVDLQLKDRAFATDIYAKSSITLKRLNQ